MYLLCFERYQLFTKIVLPNLPFLKKLFKCSYAVCKRTLHAQCYSQQLVSYSRYLAFIHVPTTCSPCHTNSARTTLKTSTVAGQHQETFSTAPNTAISVVLMY